MINKQDEKKPKCTFSTDITEQISCCQDGKFNDMGFPINKCPNFPCQKYKDLVSKINERRKEQDKYYIRESKN
jgi:hypothetical protein